jgi:hypothetical protein
MSRGASHNVSIYNGKGIEYGTFFFTENSFKIKILKKNQEFEHVLDIVGKPLIRRI